MPQVPPYASAYDTTMLAANIPCIGGQPASPGIGGPRSQGVFGGQQQWGNIPPVQNNTPFYQPNLEVPVGLQWGSNMTRATGYGGEQTWTQVPPTFHNNSVMPGTQLRVTPEAIPKQQWMGNPPLIGQSGYPNPPDNIPQAQSIRPGGT